MDNSKIRIYPYFYVCTSSLFLHQSYFHQLWKPYKYLVQVRTYPVADVIRRQEKLPAARQ